MSSRLLVRPAVYNWFNGTVTGLNTMYNAEPKMIPEQNFFQGAGNPGVGSGAVGYVDFGDEWEKRVALGGPISGKKMFTAITYLVMKFMSLKAKAEDGQVDFDTIIDAAKVRLRADRTLGGAVFAAGEGDGPGTLDIEILGGAPRIDGNGTLHMWAAMKFHVHIVLTT